MFDVKKAAYEEVNGFAKKWWIFLILGLLGIAFGVWMLMNQGIAYRILSYVFAVFFLVTGIIRVVFIIKYRNSIPAWGWPLIPALLVVALGVALCFTEWLPENILYMMYGFGIIFAGVDCICNVVMIEGVFGKILTVLLGFITIAAGTMVLLNPIVGVLTVVMLSAIGVFSFSIGCLSAAYSLSVMKSSLNKLQ